MLQRAVDAGQAGVLAHARRIAGEIVDLEQLLGTSRGMPTGLLRVHATLGFGRSHVAPLSADFARRHPQLEVQLQRSVNPPPLTDDSFDVCIRFGAPPDSRLIACHIAPNRRLLCAEWDIAHHLASGRLVQVLPQCRTPDADVYAVRPQRHQLATRVLALSAR